MHGMDRATQPLREQGGLAQNVMIQFCRLVVLVKRVHERGDDRLVRPRR